MFFSLYKTNQDLILATQHYEFRSDILLIFNQTPAENPPAFPYLEDNSKQFLDILAYVPLYLIYSCFGCTEIAPYYILK